MKQTATRIVAGLAITTLAITASTVPSSAAQRRFGAGAGSSRAHITAMEGRIGRSLDLSVLETDTSSKVSPRLDQASADWHIASVEVGGEAGLHLPAEPFQAKVKEEPSGRDARSQFGSENTSMKLPESGQSVTADWDRMRSDVSFLAENLTGMSMDPDGGPRGADDVSMLDGALLRVTANPAGLVTEQNAVRSFAHAQSEVQLVRMLEGLNSIVDAGPGDHGSVTEDDQAGAWSREVKIEEMRLLQLSALLKLLQVNVDLLPPAVMAAMVDVLGLEPGDLANHTVDFTEAELRSLMEEFGDLEGTVQAAEDLLNGLLDGAGMVGCDDLDSYVKTNEGLNLDRVSQAFGIGTLDCLGGLNALEDYIRRVEGLVAAFDAMLHDAAEEVAVIGVDDIDMGMVATAAVSDAGVPQGGVLIDATAAVIRFGKETVGSFSVADNMSSWNQVESIVNDRLNTLLAPLGTSFRDVVRIQMAPTVIEEVGVDGKWVSAKGQFEFMKAFVAPPAIDPAQLIEDVGGMTGVDLAGLVDAVLALLPVGPSGTGEVVGTVEDTLGDVLAFDEESAGTDPEDTLDELVEDLVGSAGGGLGGGVLGGGAGVLGQVEAGDPIEFTFGVMNTEARHTRPGWDIDTCRELELCPDPDPECDADPACTDTTDLANTPWDPTQGAPGGGGLPGQGGSLPRTGGYPGALAMLMTATGAALIWRRK